MHLSKFMSRRLRLTLKQVGIEETSSSMLTTRDAACNLAMLQASTNDREENAA